MTKKNFKRMTIDDLLPGRSEDSYVLTQDARTGKPRVIRAKKKKTAPKPYCKQYPMFFRLINDNPGIPDPVEEFKFHPKRKWEIDISWPEHKLALEIEGGIYMKDENGNAKGHRAIARFLSDMEKYNNLSLLGWSLLRFTTKEMVSCESYDIVREWFKNNIKKE